MKLLHIGSGFRPLRQGGLVAYAEDLMQAQVERGHEVTYLFSGRYYPWHGRPRLKRWRRDGVEMLEIVSSPLYDHGRQPALELSEPRTERLLGVHLRERRPDVVHVHELAGLPFSLLDIVRGAGIPVVMTLQDYFALCPTFKLLDSSGEVCLRRDIGGDCVATSAADPREPGLLIAATLRYDVEHRALTRALPAPARDRLLRVADRVGFASGRAHRRRSPNGSGSAAAYQRRRDQNVERLGRADVLIAMSTRVKEIYATLGVDEERLRTMQLTLGHIEHLCPARRRDDGPRDTVTTFATLAAFESDAKGGALVLDAVRMLNETTAARGRFRVVVHGRVQPGFAEQARGVPGIVVRGPYRRDELDVLLDEVDVGLLTPLWEEAYGYAGVEFLAKGIPILANAIGGTLDYAREGETGWLNRSCSAAELAAVMHDLIHRPEEVERVATLVRRDANNIVKPMATHASEMDRVYEECSATIP